MTTVANQVSDKILCPAGCGNSYTKATFDKNGGICKRCAKKVPAESLCSSIVTSLTPILSTPQVFPASSIANHLSIPMANMSLTSDAKSLPVQALTYSARLNIWAETLKKVNANNIKVFAAIDAVIVSASSDHKKMEAVLNIHLLPLEKKWNLDLNAYL